LGPIQNLPPNHRHFENYYKIARHYKWALTEVFDALLFDQVIIVEGERQCTSTLHHPLEDHGDKNPHVYNIDDLEIAPDFFNYFEATLPLLRQDPSIMCVSAWNDNGKSQFISDPEKLYRSDFFPGLGWMMTKELWDELDEKWPSRFPFPFPFPFPFLFLFPFPLPSLHSLPFFSTQLPKHTPM